MRCLKVGADPESALAAAQRMAAFVLGRGRSRSSSPAAEAPAPTRHDGNRGAAPPAVTAFSGGRGRWRRKKSKSAPRSIDRHAHGMAPKRPKARQSTQEIQALAEEYLAKHGPTREPVTLESVVRFMRSRDFVVVDKDDGTYELDSRHILTAGQLVERANKVRMRMGKPCFPDSVLENR